VVLNEKQFGEHFIYLFKKMQFFDSENHLMPKFSFSCKDLAIDYNLIELNLQNNIQNLKDVHDGSLKQSKDQLNQNDLSKFSLIPSLHTTVFSAISKESNGMKLESLGENNRLSIESGRVMSSEGNLSMKISKENKEHSPKEVTQIVLDNLQKSLKV